MKDIEFSTEATTENFEDLLELASAAVKIDGLVKKLIWKLADVFDVIIRFLLGWLITGLSYLLLVIILGNYAFMPLGQLPQHILYFSLGYIILSAIISMLIGLVKGHYATYWIYYDRFELPRPKYEVFESFSEVASHLKEGNLSLEG